MFSRPPDCPPYADAGLLLRETLAGLLPPQRITVAEFAAQQRWVPSVVGGHLVRWDPATAPYLTEPMQALTDDAFDTVAIVGPAACGKTMVAENWLLHTIAVDPAAMLWYANTDPVAETYAKSRIEPMLEAHEPLIGSRRHGRDAVGFKRFTGGRVEFLPFTRSALVNKHVARIVADEFDAYDESLGDPMPLLNPRRQAAGAESMLLAISHPDLGAPIGAPRDQQRGIMGLYADSDRRTWWWACPHCRAYSSPNPGTARHMALTWPEDAPLECVEAEARLLCPVCGVLITDGERHGMLATGKWLALGEEIDEADRITCHRTPRSTAGFWIVGAMSPFVRGGLGGLARTVEQAKRESVVAGDDRSFREAMVKSWGVPFIPARQVGTIEAAVLAERARPDLRLGEVPEGCRLLTTAVDIQGNRFELLTRGWGLGLESWVIDYRQIPADPATDGAAWDALLAELTTLSYPLADGSGRSMRVRCAVYDAVGQPGVTEQAYAAWLRARRAGRVRRAGKINGRDAWSLLPARGASAAQAPRLSITYPDGARTDRRAAAQGQVPLAVFNPNWAKDALASQLARGEPGPGAVHIPAALRSPAPPHAFFEQLAAERRDRRGAWAKAQQHLRNEAFDLMVMAEIAARLHGAHRIDWTRPPGWAADWDGNSMVAGTAAASIAPPAPPIAVAAPAPVYMPGPRPSLPPAPAIAARSAGARLAAMMR